MLEKGKEMIVMKVFKKNQILIFVAALALVTTGYVASNQLKLEDNNYISTTLDTVETSGIGDATLVSSPAIINEIVSNVVEGKKEEKLVENAKNMDDYFTSSRIERDKMYSQMLENYQKIMDNPNISNEQKSIAVNEITNINNAKNAIMITENLIKTKGVEDVIIFINSDSVNVVIKAEELTSNRVAQVQNIVSRELKAEVENIHISNK